MTRDKHGSSTKKHKNILKLAKGYIGASSRTFSAAMRAVVKANQYNYRDRKAKKRDMRSLWISRINAGVRMYDSELSYSKFMHALKENNIDLNRKILSDLSIFEPETFSGLVKIASVKYETVSK